MLFAQIQLFPEQASTLAPQVDAVFFYVLSLSAFFSILIAGLVIFFAIRYRRRSPKEIPAAIHGSMFLELTWTLIPLGLVMILFVWGANVYFAIAHPPDDALDSRAQPGTVVPDHARRRGTADYLVASALGRKCRDR